jgi:hypothetical protein
MNVISWASAAFPVSNSCDQEPVLGSFMDRKKCCGTNSLNTLTSPKCVVGPLACTERQRMCPPALPKTNSRHGISSRPIPDTFDFAQCKLDRLTSLRHGYMSISRCGAITRAQCVRNVRTSRATEDVACMPTTGHDKDGACPSAKTVSCSTATLLGRDQDRSSTSSHAPQTTWNTHGQVDETLRRGAAHVTRKARLQ